MKKLLAVLGSLFILIGVKAQTVPAKKETTKPTATKAVTGLPPVNPNDKHKGEAPAFTKGPSQFNSSVVKPVGVPVTGTKKKG